MDYRGFEILEERLRRAILKENIHEVRLLLKKKAFRMLGEEMDELLKQLGNESLQKLQKRMSRKRNDIDVLSKEAQLKYAVELNQLDHIRRIMEKQNCCSEYHLRASSIASIAMYAMRATLTPNYAIIEFLLQCACDVEPQMWDAEVALPILYNVLSESPASLRNKVLHLPDARTRSVPVAFLHLAAKLGDVGMVSEIISDRDLYVGVDDMYVGDSNEATALLRASHHGHEKVVAYLISCWGADMRKRDRYGRTALHVASAQGHGKVVRVLLQAVRDDPVRLAGAAAVLGIRRRRKQVVVQEEGGAHEFEEEEVLQMMTTTTVAAAGGSVEVTHMRVDYLDGVDEWGMSALHLAVCAGYTGIVNQLLDAGADPSLRAPHHPHTKFTFFLDTYLAVCRKEVVDYEKLYYTTSKTKKDVAVEEPPYPRRRHRNDCFRLSPVMSVYWHPGGFTALHFAVAYARSSNDAVNLLQALLRSDPEDDVRGMKDTSGLTALDWAAGMLKKHEEEEEVEEEEGGMQREKEARRRERRRRRVMRRMIHMLGGGGAEEDVVRYKVRGQKQVLERMEERKNETEWCDMLGRALRSGEFAVAEALAREHRRWVKHVLSDATIDHLKWAATEQAAAVKEEWKWNEKRRGFVVAEKGWARKVEGVLVELIKVEGGAAAVKMEMADLQQLLVWALRNGMADLAITLSAREECELVEPLRGGAESIAPLDAAAAWRTRVWEIEPVLLFMESRSGVRESVLRNRDVYIAFLNALLVASVLIGGLAFSAILQPPQNVLSSLSSSSSSSSAAVMTYGSRWWRLTTAAAANSLPPEQLNHTLANIFIWSTHISFFFAMIATFGGICGSIPPSKGQLAYSTRRIVGCIALSTVFIAGAVIAMSFSFGAAILDVLNRMDAERWRLKVFAVTVGSLGGIVLMWIARRLMQIWESAREIELQARRRFRNETMQRRCVRLLGLLGIFCILVFLDWVYPVLNAVLIGKESWKDEIQKRCLNAACKMCGHRSGSAIVYKSLRSLGVRYTYSEEDSLTK